MRVLLRVAYDGSAYCGYQIQDNGDTIQEELEKALLDLSAFQSRQQEEAERTQVCIPWAILWSSMSRRR